jgi:PAS domain S-box-containing protein
VIKDVGKSWSSLESQGLTSDQLHSLVDSIPDGIVAVNLDSLVTFVNRAAERITGVHNRCLGDLYCHSLFNIQASECPLCRTLSSLNPVVNCYVCAFDRDGRRIPLSVSTALLYNHRAKVVGGVMTFRDLNQVEVMQKKLASSYTFVDMVGQSRVMREVFELIPIIAKSDSTVLIEGESGTGKELVARAIHQSSSRRNKPLVCVNANAIPDALIESELFGYKAGAFTDAKFDRKGRFAVARGGTIFLDEIGYISPLLQVKLLRVLQEHAYEPLGSTETIRADVRVITATNRNLTALMEAGDFRQDLYYRLNVLRVKLPPLRERLDDVPLIIQHFINRFNKHKNKDITSVSPEAMKLLTNYSYPGNVRELENIIEHAFALCPGGEIIPDHLPFNMNAPRRIETNVMADSLEAMEAIFLTNVLKRNSWSRHKTAKELGLSSSTLYRKLKRLGLDLPYSNQDSHDDSLP